MPDQPKNKHRMVRFSDEDWADFGDMAKAAGRDRSAILRQLAQWWMRRSGITLPGRPESSDNLVVDAYRREEAADQGIGSKRGITETPRQPVVPPPPRRVVGYSKEQQARGKKA